LVRCIADATLWCVNATGAAESSLPKAAMPEKRERTPEDVRAVDDEIRRHTADLVAAYNSANLDHALSYFAPDVIYMPPDRELRGDVAITIGRGVPGDVLDIRARDHGVEWASNQGIGEARFSAKKFESSLPHSASSTPPCTSGR